MTLFRIDLLPFILIHVQSLTQECLNKRKVSLRSPWFCILKAFICGAMLWFHSVEGPWWLDMQCQQRQQGIYASPLVPCFGDTWVNRAHWAAPLSANCSKRRQSDPLKKKKKISKYVYILRITVGLCRTEVILFSNISVMKCLAMKWWNARFIKKY